MILAGLSAKLSSSRQVAAASMYIDTDICVITGSTTITTILCPTMSSPTIIIIVAPTGSVQFSSTGGNILVTGFVPIFECQAMIWNPSTSKWSRFVEV